MGNLMRAEAVTEETARSRLLSGGLNVEQATKTVYGDGPDVLLINVQLEQLTFIPFGIYWE